MPRFELGKGFHSSGQIIATSHDLTPNGGLVREIPGYFREIQVGEILFHLARFIHFPAIPADLEPTFVGMGI